MIRIKAASFENNCGYFLRLHQIACCAIVGTSFVKPSPHDKNNFRAYVHQQAPLALKPLLLNAARELIPGIQKNDLSLSSKVGIRSQLYNLKKEALENDFLCIQKENSTHILNAISPAFTASFELADLIIKQSGF